MTQKNYLILMCPNPHSEVVVVDHDIAGDGHGAVEDVVEGDDRCNATSSQADDDEKIAVNSLPECQFPVTKKANIDLVNQSQMEGTPSQKYTPRFIRDSHLWIQSLF